MNIILLLARNILETRSVVLDVRYRDIRRILKLLEVDELRKMNHFTEHPGFPKEGPPETSGSIPNSLNVIGASACTTRLHLNVIRASACISVSSKIHFRFSL